MNNTTSLELAREYRKRIAEGIPRDIARLYSQHTRLRERQAGLKSWRFDEALQRLNDAVELMEVADIEKEANQPQGDSQGWKMSLRRAGEILEWLSHEEIGIDFASTELLAAAAYQLAGYPARADGLLKNRKSDVEGIYSRPLRKFLQLDSKALFEVLMDNWIQVFSSANTEQRLIEESSSPTIDEFSQEITRLVSHSILSAIGVLTAEMRWGNEFRVQKAIDKLKATSQLLLHCDEPYLWLLFELCAKVSETYKDTLLRNFTEDLELDSDSGYRILDRYLRLSFREGRIIAWPSQILGIARLGHNRSFVLCTPTGSGKTTVAEVTPKICTT